MSLLANIADALPAAPTAARIPEVITPDQIRYAADMSLLQVFTALMIHASFVTAILGLIAFALNWRKTGYLFFALFGAAVFSVPQGYCSYYGGIAFCVAIAGLLYQFTHPPVRIRTPVLSSAAK